MHKGTVQIFTGLLGMVTIIISDVLYRNDREYMSGFFFGLAVFFVSIAIFLMADDMITLRRRKQK